MIDNEEMRKIMAYMRGHWPSLVREEWRVKDEQYPELVKKVFKDWTAEATQGRRFFRVAGQSGSGKTTQLLPAAEAWFEARGGRPVLVAARRLVKYHPFAEEIRQEYGDSQQREMTHEVTTILMFLMLKELILGGYDMILDVTLLDPTVEGLLMKMLKAMGYEVRLNMMAVSRAISDELIARRQQTSRTKRMVAQKTATEFWRATRVALEFYVEKFPELLVVVWNAWSVAPVFDGKLGDARFMEAMKKYWTIDDLPESVGEDKLREAKIRYMRSWA